VQERFSIKEAIEVRDRPRRVDPIVVFEAQPPDKLAQVRAELAQIIQNGKTRRT
jgi:hypothetical protein